MRRKTGTRPDRDNGRKRAGGGRSRMCGRGARSSRRAGRGALEGRRDLARSPAPQSDHETSELRQSGKSFYRLSQGPYGGRVGRARILRSGSNTPSRPRSSCRCSRGSSNRTSPRRRSRGHERGIHSWLREFSSTLLRGAERDLAFRARDVPARPGGMHAAPWDFSPATLAIIVLRAPRQDRARHLPGTGGRRTATGSRAGRRCARASTQGILNP